MTNVEYAIATAIEAEVSTNKILAIMRAQQKVLTSALKRGDVVVVSGIGTYYVGKRAARIGRDPRNQRPIIINAAKRIRLKASQKAHDTLL